jgi:hypothetical protein
MKFQAVKSVFTYSCFAHKVYVGTEVEDEINLRPTVSPPVCLGVRHPSRTRDQFFFLLEISFRQLRVCYFVSPSLTRRRVYNLLYSKHCCERRIVVLIQMELCLTTKWPIFDFIRKLQSLTVLFSPIQLMTGLHAR